MILTPNFAHRVRIATLHRAIADGRYEIDVAAVAEAFLRRMALRAG